MKVLVLSMARHGFQEACQYEAALEQQIKGNEVLFLYCDGTLGICGENRRAIKGKCSICSCCFKNRLNKFLNNDIQKKSFGSYITDDIIKEAESTIFEYKDVEELKELKYHGIDVGFGALSSYITWTRNINPDFTRKEIREYFDFLLESEVKLTLILEKVLLSFRAELIVFHNGRFAYYKPALRIAQIRNIPFICTETTWDINRNMYREFIDNDIPHTISFRSWNMDRYWNSAPSAEERERIGAMLFENRRHGKYSGDLKIFVTGQEEGKLPEGFDKSIENIVIFNSSEDEMGAIGQEVQEYALFKSQFDAIVAIMERYKDDSTKHFYLRVHPNLKDLPFDYHVNLYKLNYPNLTVISGDSEISTYAMMDAADKIIVFGSSTGAEAAYWGKTVICLSFAYYYNLGCVYTPQSIEEVWKLMDTKNLPPLNGKAALKYGYCILNPYKEHFHYVDIDGSTFVFKGRKRQYPAIYKFFGSTKLSYIIYTINEELYKKMTNLGRFTRIPV